MKITPFDLLLLGTVVVLALICLREKTKPKKKGEVKWTIGPVRNKEE